MPHVSDETDSGLVLTVEEIASLAEESARPVDTLMNVVALIATHFKTDVCSAYLLEPDRSNLVLADIERLAEMVNDAKRPVQFVFAGKAHPHDEPGKKVLQQIAQMKCYIPAAGGTSSDIKPPS